MSTSTPKVNLNAHNKSKHWSPDHIDICLLSHIYRGVFSLSVINCLTHFVNVTSRHLQNKYYPTQTPGLSKHKKIPMFNNVI